MQDAKEEVRARLSIEDVIGEYVELKRAGRNFKGLSPFSDEKTPSFVVSPEKQIWHDFSSGRGGDVFSFIMEVEGYDFRAALEKLAQKAGVELSQYSGKHSGQLAKKKQRLIEANELAAVYFQQCLIKNKHAQNYVFKTRSLNKDIVHNFKIGYAPDSNNALVSILEKRGFSPQEIKAAGLTNRYGGDLFRGRMMVSLMDNNGSVIGFTGRILSENDVKAPKYLNTPATIIYDKSRHIFGLHLAKESIRKNDNAVLVEGNLDVITSHQAGVKNVVATAGTALTEYQLKSLVRLSTNVRLAFDGDKAGVSATERAIPIAQRVGADLFVVELGDKAKDPDELIKLDVKLWEKAIESSTPAIEWIIKHYEKSEDNSSATGKRIITSKSLELLKNIKDSVEVEHYLKYLANKTESSLDAIRSKFQSGNTDNIKHVYRQTNVNLEKSAPRFDGYQDDLLAVLLVTPTSRNLLDGIDIDMIVREDRQILARFLRKSDVSLTPLPLELQNIDTYVKIVELKAETRYASWQEADRKLEAARLLRRIIVEQKKEQKMHLLEKLKDAELMNDEVSAKKLRIQLHNLIKETTDG